MGALIKSKLLVKVTVEWETKVAAASDLVPGFEELCSARQAHTSHSQLWLLKNEIKIAFFFQFTVFFPPDGY